MNRVRNLLVSIAEDEATSERLHLGGSRDYERRRQRVHFSEMWAGELYCLVVLDDKDDCHETADDCAYVAEARARKAFP